MSWLFSQALVEAYSEDICSDGELSARSNGKPTQPVFSSADKTTVFSRRSLSGMTFKLLTEDHGEAVLMSFLEAFPAKTFQSPAKELESTASEAVCGDTWRESSARYCPDSSSWKTHRCLWEEDLQESSVILPRWGMMLNGVLWERITLPLLTSETESGLSLPTPCSKGSRSQGQIRQMRKLVDAGEMSRQEAEAMIGGSLEPERMETWATPTTMDSLPPKSAEALLREATEVRPGRSKPSNLRDQVSNMQNWPTPQYDDAKNSGKNQKRRETLASKVQKFPTPSASEARNGWQDRSAAAKGSQESLTTIVQRDMGRETGKEWTGGQLNPTWVEWLMGWPLGWTDLKPLATDKFQTWLSSRMKTSTNQAPQNEDVNR